LSPRTPATRRRGAQPGNTNALKHGLTARKDRPAPVRAPIHVPPKIEPVTVLLSYDEETELLRTLFTCMARLYPEANQFLEAFPVFRKLVDIIFLQASTLRAQHPLSSEDYVGLAGNLEQLMRLIAGP